MSQPVTQLHPLTRPPAPEPPPLASPGPAPGSHRPALRRHLALASFVALVVVPAAVAAFYLFARAADQFQSTVAFSVRAEDMASPAAGLLGAITQISSGSASDADILFDYARSAAMVAAVDRELDLRAIYGHAVDDPVFALAPGASAEDLHDHWGRMVHVDLDHQAGIITVEARAFTAADAEAIATAVLEHSARLVNHLSDAARQDAVRYAALDLAEAEGRLKRLRAEMAEFRRENRIVDPGADIAGRMGLLGALETELAAAMVERDTLLSYAEADDHRVAQADRRIGAISARIEAERAALGIAAPGASMADVVGRYEALLTDLEFAQAAYTQALSNLGLARAEARRQARYLAAHIPPARAETAEYPRRILLTGAVAGFLCLGWAVGMVVFYNVRDSRRAAA